MDIDTVLAYLVFWVFVTIGLAELFSLRHSSNFIDDIKVSLKLQALFAVTVGSIAAISWALKIVVV